MIKLYKNKYGRELRIGTTNTLYLINTNGCIGDETTNEDLWKSGYRIGFTRISRFFRKVGIFIFLATKEVGFPPNHQDL